MMIEKVRKHCSDIIKNSACIKLPFHDLQHTLEVVENVQLITSKCSFTIEETEPIIIAAWFHDTGFAEAYKGHEEVSIKYARLFLEKEGYNSDKLAIVLSCIEATKMPQKPSNKFAEVLCDADVYHISTPHFFYRKLLLRKEWELYMDLVITDLEWHQLNLKFIESHHYFSAYGQKEMREGRLKNVEKVKKLLTFYEK